MTRARAAPSARRRAAVALVSALSLVAGPACSALIPEIGGLRAPEDAGTGTVEVGDGGDGGDGGALPGDAGAQGGDTGAAAGPATVTVTVAPNDAHVFSPSTVTIRVGDTVRWVWAATGHTVTSGTNGNADGLFCSPADGTCAGTPTSPAGTTYDHRFESAGTFPYFCRPHAGMGMAGSVTVR
jgi:plastocyanin